MVFDKKAREELFAELEGSKFVIRKTVKIGKNQGQYFIRLPKKISDDLGITDDSELEFILTKSKRKKILTLEVK